MSEGINGQTLVDAAAQISWIDWTAGAVLAVFVVTGLFRGLVWQLTRVAILLVAYLGAIVFGPRLASLLEGWFGGGHPRLHDYLGFAVLFVLILVGLGLAAWSMGRLSELEERIPLTGGQRLAGGLVGLLTGGLIVMALLTSVQMFHDWTGKGAGVVRAAETSHTQRVGNDLLKAAGRVVPADWASQTENWRELLDDPELTPRGNFRPTDPTAVPATQQSH